MSNKRDLRAFVRYDGNQRVIPGSLVLRRSKPKVGNWKEIQTYECCDTVGCNVPPVPLSAIATGFPVDSGAGCNPYVRFQCDSLTIWEISNLSIPSNASLEEFFNIVIELYSWVGTWTLDGTTVTLEMNGSIASALCPTGELTMVVGVQCPV
jgi:hypothetical protein